MFSPSFSVISVFSPPPILFNIHGCFVFLASLCMVCTLPFFFFLYSLMHPCLHLQFSCLIQQYTLISLPTFPQFYSSSSLFQHYYPSFLFLHFPAFPYISTTPPPVSFNNIPASFLTFVFWTNFSYIYTPLPVSFSNMPAFFNFLYFLMHPCFYTFPLLILSLQHFSFSFPAFPHVLIYFLI